MVDASGSVRNERFDDLKRMIGGIINDLEIFNDRVRVAAISFCNSATVIFGLNEYNTKQDITVRQQ